MTGRFEVTQVVPGKVWAIFDRRQYCTEFVLFADSGVNHARLWVSDEALSQCRSEALRELAYQATRAGVRHSFRPPPPLPVAHLYDGS